MSDRLALVVTTINYPTKAVLDIQAGCDALAAPFYVIGDGKSPTDFTLPGARYYDLASQRDTGLRFAQACPTGHYARKNVGYLVAIKDGADIIVETDDDNIPLEGFWRARTRTVDAPVVTKAGWCNAYRYFTEAQIWPRGLPLVRVNDPVDAVESLPVASSDSPIQQGLADGNPDVDAVYRLILPLPIDFRDTGPVTLGEGVWCPFNSQNTSFWRDAFPLLYLPAYCSFRMTDIWRSFVAQRIMWECGWRLSFHGATVVQERNEHDLHRDFTDEVPGYLHNDRIKKTLEDLPMARGVGGVARNLTMAYEALVALELVGREELPLLQAWLHDLEAMPSPLA